MTDEDIEPPVTFEKFDENHFKVVLCDINKDIPDNCPFTVDKNCTDCPYGQKGYRDRQWEMIEELTTFDSHRGTELNYRQTIIRTETVDMLKAQYQYVSDNFDEYEEMDTDDIPWAYVRMRYPELWKFVTAKNYRKPHKYLFKDDESPLIAVYEGAVYTVAPRLTEDDTEEEE